jgi:hypothetical protein
VALAPDFGPASCPGRLSVLSALRSGALRCHSSPTPGLRPAWGCCFRKKLKIGVSRLDHRFRSTALKPWLSPKRLTKSTAHSTGGKARFPEKNRVSRMPLGPLGRLCDNLGLNICSENRIYKLFVPILEKENNEIKLPPTR